MIEKKKAKTILSSAKSYDSAKKSSKRIAC